MYAYVISYIYIPHACPLMVEVHADMYIHVEYCAYLSF